MDVLMMTGDRREVQVSKCFRTLVEDRDFGS